MHGVLANIIEVPEEYQTAIEMCLGASLQNIVTETEEDAKKLVQHLRKNNLGRASFLPITSVRGRKLDKIKGHEKGVVGIASDLVKFNKKYEQIVLNLLGRTVIVDNMETAIKVAKQNGYTFRIITIEGDVINPSGAITGGSVAKKTVNILGRGREIEKLEKETKKLREKVAELEKEKQEYERSMEDTFEGATSLEKELQEIDITYATEKQKLVSIEENIAAVFEMTLDEFITAFDEGTIKFYAADPTTGVWDTESAYTGEQPAGYWFDETGKVCAYPGVVCANFKPDSDEVSKSCVKLCCMPETPVGKQYNCSFGFIDTTDATKFFRFVVTCNITE